MHRFVTEMNPRDWNYRLSNVDPRVRWAITEEGDQLWHVQGKWLTENRIQIGSGSWIQLDASTFTGDPEPLTAVLSTTFLCRELREHSRG